MAKRTTRQILAAPALRPVAPPPGDATRLPAPTRQSLAPPDIGSHVPNAVAPIAGMAAASVGSFYALTGSLNPATPAAPWRTAKASTGKAVTAPQAPIGLAAAVHTAARTKTGGTHTPMSPQEKADAEAAAQAERGAGKAKGKPAERASRVSYQKKDGTTVQTTDGRAKRYAAQTKHA